MREFDPWDLVETVREDLLLLDSDLAIRFANHSFCDTFAVAPEDAVGRKLDELGNGQWDIPELRSLARDYHFWRPVLPVSEITQTHARCGATARAGIRAAPTLVRGDVVMASDRAMRRDGALEDSCRPGQQRGICGL